MNVRDQINRLETLLQRIQSHARARRQTGLGERRLALESYTSVAPAGAIEVVESPPLEALDDADVVEMDSDVLESVPPPPVASYVPPMAASAPPSAASAPPIAAYAPPIAESAPPSAPIPELFAREEIPGTDRDFEDEEAPASSKRHRIMGTIDDAVSAAEREPVLMEEGREIPLKTPPPESGPQEAPLPPGSLAPAPPPDLSDLLDELPPAEHAIAARPRPEQLGETIELSEPAGPPLELDADRAFTPPPYGPPDVTEELEVTLPLGKYAGKYDEALMPPPEARQDLLAHRRKSGEVLAPSRSAYAEEQQAPQPPTPSEPSQIAVRGSLSGLSAAEFSTAKLQTSKTFIEMLDESIRLGGD